MITFEHRLLNAVELAEALAVSLSTIRRMTRHGEIPVLRLRSLLRYDLEDVKARLTVGQSSRSRAK